MSLRYALVFSAVYACGCAPALSSLQPAHVAEKGHVQAEVGMDISIPTGTIASALDAGVALAEAAQREELTEPQRKRVFDAGVGLALNPPSATPHIGVAYTVVDNLELNLRYSVSAFRGGVRYQFLDHEKHGVDLTVGLGAARYVYDLPVNSFIDILELEDFTRWQFDLPIAIGTSGDWYRVWGGPRLMYTTFSTALTLDLPSPGDIELASFSGNGLYVGGQIGAALGYKKVFLGVELTLVQLFSGGDLEAFGQKALEVELNSFVIYPTIGLMGEF